MTRKLLLLFVVCFASNFAFSQTLEELTTQKTAKEAELATLADALAKADAIKADIAGIDGKLANLQGWQVGALGNLGLNFSQFNKWLGAANPDVYTASYGATGNLFANLQTEGYFWRNGLNVIATKTKVALTEADKEANEFETTADAVNLNSLFGYKLNSKWAISALGEYRSTLLDNFNNPGYLDIGAGATWTPIPNAVVVFHPLNYNFVMADDALSYESSLGCKIVADYSRALPVGVAWKTNLSAFVSYGDTPNLSNWTWTNGLSANVWKGIGVGLEFGLRGNKQEALNFTQIAQEDTTLGFDDIDNQVQSYWVLGLSYSF